MAKFRANASIVKNSEALPYMIAEKNNTPTKYTTARRAINKHKYDIFLPSLLKCKKKKLNKITNHEGTTARNMRRFLLLYSAECLRFALKLKHVSFDDQMQSKL